MNLKNKLIWFYEDKMLYRFNWCDVDGFRMFAPLGKGFTEISPKCRCCASVRWMLGAVAAHFVGLNALQYAGVILLLACVAAFKHARNENLEIK